MSSSTPHHNSVTSNTTDPIHAQDHRQNQKTDTHGNLIGSSDPTTYTTASTTQKIKGDVAGALHGTVGSMQAATGAAMRNKGMEEKGLEKMSDEDHRLGAKRGVPPVGTDKRNTTIDQLEGEGATGAHGKQI